MPEMDLQPPESAAKNASILTQRPALVGMARVRSAGCGEPAGQAQRWVAENRLKVGADGGFDARATGGPSGMTPSCKSAEAEA